MQTLLPPGFEARVFEKADHEKKYLFGIITSLRSVSRLAITY
jgi:hypothetical protein